MQDYDRNIVNSGDYDMHLPRIPVIDIFKTPITANENVYNKMVLIKIIN
jgi:hypothetical protein